MTKQAFEMRATQIAGFPAMCDDFGQQDTSLSPDGNWLAIHCGYKRNQILEIVSSEGKQWVLQFKDYLAEEYIIDGSTPMGGLYPAHWTPDEGYLYFTSYIAWDGGGTCVYSFGYEGLYRINLNSGAVSTTLSDGSFGYEIAFSPSGRWLAYDAIETVVLDLITGDKFIIEAGDKVVGDLTWSPDGSELAFATCRSSQDGFDIEKSTVEIYSLEMHTSRTILEAEKIFFEIMAWDGNNSLRIVSYDWQTGETSQQFFDWSLERLITPTLQPK